jgi:nitrogen-specific signal transduction histidine kinase/CheY-like chemotaxis protein
LPFKEVRPIGSVADKKASNASAERAALAERARRLEALARVSAEAAHSFNNVLQVIQSAAEILRQRLPREHPGLAGLVDMLQRNVERGAGLTRKMLAFSGRSTLEPDAINVNALIAGFIDRLREVGGSGMRVDTKLHPGLPTLSADAGALQTALLNLAANSRDAMHERGSLRIETREAAKAEVAAAVAEPLEAERYVAISVSDTGAGMSPEVLDQAYEPYFTTKERGSGMGLGLSQVYGFARQSGGHLAIESAPGRGTTAILYLPCMTEGAPDSLGKAPAALATDDALAGLRVLLVEDESLIAMLAEDLLTQLGCKLAGMVPSVQKALAEATQRSDIDLAILDVDLGGEAVYPVASALRARSVPFIFMTGYGGLHESWRDSPILQKPFDAAALKAAIESALAPRRGA